MTLSMSRPGAEVLFQNADTATAEARMIFQAQSAAFLAEPYRPRKRRDADLALLLRVIRHNRHAICEAISTDFGNRSEHETRITEILGSINSVRYARRKLKKWMRPRRRSTSIWFLPGGNKVVPAPLGVVGIMSPWNYPVHLTVAPLAAALAAGDRVMIKMSEVTPTTTALLKRLLSEAFPRDQVAVIDGAAEVAKAFSSLPFSHLLFTGSTAVGREVTKAASENLTPVTLELSGKSPAIVDAGYPLKEAAKRITWGKLFNAGQTCVAPDYVLVPEGKAEAFCDAALASARKLYPSISDNRQYTSIVDGRHHERLRALVEAAKQGGARVVEAWSEAEAAQSRKFPFTLVTGAAPEMAVLQEEIFGPILPVLEYRDLDEAAAFINGRPRPLSMYVFSRRASPKRRILREVSAGGVTINDTLLHYLQDDLPFGGVGASGFGRYHGREGFETFSQQKSVFTQRGFGSFTGAKFLYPPYGRIANMMIGIMSR